MSGLLFGIWGKGKTWENSKELLGSLENFVREWEKGEKPKRKKYGLELLNVCICMGFGEKVGRLEIAGEWFAFGKKEKLHMNNICKVAWEL